MFFGSFLIMTKTCSSKGMILMETSIFIMKLEEIVDPSLKIQLRVMSMHDQTLVPHFMVSEISKLNVTLLKNELMKRGQLATTYLLKEILLQSAGLHQHDRRMVPAHSISNLMTDPIIENANICPPTGLNTLTNTKLGFDKKIG